MLGNRMIEVVMLNISNIAIAVVVILFPETFPIFFVKIAMYFSFP